MAKGESRGTKAKRSQYAGGCMKPCWSTYYRLGVELNRQMPYKHTLREVGTAFGLTYQNAYTETVVALGKVVFRLRQLKEFQGEH